MRDAGIPSRNNAEVNCVPIRDCPQHRVFWTCHNTQNIFSMKYSESWHEMGCGATKVPSEVSVKLKLVRATDFPPTDSFIATDAWSIHLFHSSVARLVGHLYRFHCGRKVIYNDFDSPCEKTQRAALLDANPSLTEFKRVKAEFDPIGTSLRTFAVFDDEKMPMQTATYNL